MKKLLHKLKGSIVYIILVGLIISILIKLYLDGRKKNNIEDKL